MQAGMCLRIYLTESDRINGKPALEEVLSLCRASGLRGVTVLRAIEGQGAHDVHSASFLSLASALPLVVEAIDTPEAIERAIAAMRPHLGQRMMATWPVSFLYGGDQGHDD